MFELFYEGGMLFMSILTIIFVSMITVAIIISITVLRGKLDINEARSRISYIKSVGFFALVIGILAQLIGLYTMFDAIAEVGDVSQSLVFGGLKVSTVANIYGFCIYIISYLIWLGLSFKLN